MNEEGGENGVSDRKENAKRYNSLFDFLSHVYVRMLKQQHNSLSVCICVYWRMYICVVLYLTSPPPTQAHPSYFDAPEPHPHFTRAALEIVGVSPEGLTKRPRPIASAYHEEDVRPPDDAARATLGFPPGLHVQVGVGVCVCVV
jgi:hypothetical protein